MKKIKNAIIHKYETEIEGLRALSVISVILYHADIYFNKTMLFKGGFVGVDIFFTISGYLITIQILRNIKEGKEFSLKDFYLRRARRIIPALFLIIIFFIPFGYFYFLPNELINYSNSLIASITFISNFFYYFKNLEYNLTLSQLIPFLHTWSLAIEAQFYLLFPLFFYFIVKKFNKKIIQILIIFTIFSFSIFFVLKKIDPLISFYLFPTRIWEFLCGSLVAIIKFNNKYYLYKNFFKKYTYNLLPKFGLLLIFISIFFLNDDNKNIIALNTIPIIGSALIILFAHQKELVYKILSLRIIVFIGLISYSLYLWHYPIFAFSRISEFIHGNIYKKILLAIIIIILSILSYFFIEKPFRNKKKISNKKFLILVAIFFIIIFSINYIFIKTKGMIDRLPNSIKGNINNNLGAYFLDEKNKLCKQQIHNYCIYNKGGSSGKVFLVGDSIMGSISESLKNELIKNNFEFTPIISPSNWYLPNFNKIYYNNNEIKFSYKKQNVIKEILISNPNSIIIIGGLLPQYLSNMNFDNEEGALFRGKLDSYYKHYTNNKKSTEEGIIESINELLINDNKIIIIYPVPEVGWNTAQEIFRRYRIIEFKKVFNKLLGNQQFAKNTEVAISTSYNVYKKRTNASFLLLNRINNKNIYRVFPDRLFCNSNTMRCLASDENYIYYTDNIHLSKKGAEMINNEVLKIIFNKIKSQ